MTTPTLRPPATENERSWLERMADDPSLRAFVDAEIARAGIEVATAKGEAEHWRDVAMRLDAKLAALRPDAEQSRHSNRERQAAHRRRHAFAAPMTESLL